MPIAARDEAAIERFIGKITHVLRHGAPNQAVLIETHETPPSDRNLPIWDLKESAILHKSAQVWVHVDFKEYRKVYELAFPQEDIRGLVLDHILNRRAARLMGFKYLRIIPISRGANSSSGGVAEKYGVEYHRTAALVQSDKISSAFIQYADLADIVKMLDLKTGGTLQDGVRDAIPLIEPRCSNGCKPL